MNHGEPAPIRFLAWNILHGGSGRRLPHIALEMVSHRPDVVAISEFRPTLGGQMLAILADRGLVHVAEASEGLAPGRNRMLIASRFELSPALPDDAPAMPSCLHRRVLVRRLGPDGAGVVLTAAHLPDDWTPSAALHGWAWLAAHAARLQNELHVILGDLNGSRDRGQIGGAPPHVAHALGRLATAGYTDAFESVAKGSGNEFRPETTWKSHWGHELRLDHAIVSKQLRDRIREAAYSHSPRIQAVSDHSAVVLELACEAASEELPAQKCGKNHEETGFGPM